MKHDDRGTYRRFRTPSESDELARKRILCISYTNHGGAKTIMRSSPLSYKEAYRRKREYEALKKGDACWVEMVPAAVNSQ